MVRDVVASVHRSGFRRVLIVNGHGGNTPVAALAQELMAERPSLSVKFHSWWNAPRTWAKVQEIDPSGTHANWMENFPVDAARQCGCPRRREARARPRADARLAARGRRAASSATACFGGDYQKPDEVMLELWRAGVEETREALEGPWPSRS